MHFVFRKNKDFPLPCLCAGGDNFLKGPLITAPIDTIFARLRRFQLVFLGFIKFLLALGIQSPSENGFMEPKYKKRFVSVIGHPNHSSSENMTPRPSGVAVQSIHPSPVKRPKM